MTDLQHEKFHHNGEIPSSKSVTQMMEFLQVKSPFIGVMCNPTVAIATKKCPTYSPTWSFSNSDFEIFKLT